MQIDHIHKDDSGQVLFVRLVKVDAKGSRQYHRTSFNQQDSSRMLTEVEADLEQKGWGRLEDEDRQDLKDVVSKLFEPDGTRPNRPRPTADRAWQQVEKLLGFV